jgi:hypothetical protein
MCRSILLVSKLMTHSGEDMLSLAWAMKNVLIVQA